MKHVALGLVLGGFIGVLGTAIAARLGVVRPLKERGVFGTLLALFFTTSLIVGLGMGFMVDAEMSALLLVIVILARCLDTPFLKNLIWSPTRKHEEREAERETDSSTG